MTRSVLKYDNLSKVTDTCVWFQMKKKITEHKEAANYLRVYFKCKAGSKQRVGPSTPPPPPKKKKIDVPVP